jgi:hypothetical protein
MRLHVYTAGDPAPTTLADLEDHRQVREIIEIEEREHVFLLGSDIEIDVDLTVIEAFGPGNHVVTKHSCRDIVVRVDYVGRHAQLEHVHPATSVSEVEKQIFEKLHIDPNQAAELELHRQGTNDVLSGAVPLGAYVKPGVCRIELDLCPIVRNQG